ncbi:MAG: leucine-rich repeat protein [Oscillospiraceae bacterium]|nr:leucine-rich repeat protein [Oscillospiraceae bacterium]MBR3446933.1 leucine-rich repeat protein [Oscillospiraceae bacterium]
MDFSFYAWLEAFSDFLNGLRDTPPVPPTQPVSQAQNVQQPKPAAAPQTAKPLSPERNTAQPVKPPKPPAAQDQITLRSECVYIIPRLPEGGWQDPEPVPRIALTAEEALAQGWRFCVKKAGRIKITHYRGAEKNIVIPAQIGMHIVNELAAGLFEKANIDSAMLPETVRRLGTRCFAGSLVKKLVIAGPVKEIPPEFAACCRQLAAVQHHPETSFIRRCAFEHCVSLRQFSISPEYFTIVGEGAFRGSGLQAFSCHERSDLCGSAFADTPLWKHYKLLMQNTFRNNYFTVVLAGRDARSLRLPEINITFAAQSIPDRKDGLNLLDCSQCSGVKFDNYAIVYSPGKQYGTRSREPLFITVPEKTLRFFYAGHTEVQYADGEPFPPFLTKISEDDSEAVYEVFGEDLPACTLPPEKTSIRLKGTTIHHCGWRDYRLCYEKEAVQSRRLERITFEMPLSGTEPLFAEECRSLHYVSWIQTREQVQVYLPSADVIGEWVHWYLLKAFHAYYKPFEQYFARHEDHLFRSDIFDRAFRQQDHTGIPKGVIPAGYPYSLWLYKRCGVPVLKQRQKIVLAADVLRSTPKLFPNRKMYRDYLLTHRRYALKLCETLPEEYADCLREFYKVKP